MANPTQETSIAVPAGQSPALALDPCSAELPSVAGGMEMTHADFQRACRVMLGRLQEDPNCDTHLIHLLCEAVRCSRECCELANIGLPLPNEKGDS